MNPAIKLGLARTLSAVGILQVLERALRSRGSLVFALHRVLPLEELGACYNPYLAITPESFDLFLMYLRKRLAVVSIEELLEYRSKKGKYPVSVLTFDDGWEDNYRVAFPLIKNHNVPATIFLPTDLIESLNLLPEERFSQVMLGPQSGKCAELLRRDLQAARVIDTRIGTQGMGELQRSFKQLDFDTKTAFLSEAENISGIQPPAKSSFMDWGQVKEMKRAGIAFGSHTKRHAILSANSPEFVQTELLGSKETLERQLGTKIVYFAYPNGMYNADSVNQVRAAGYRAAFTTVRAAVTADSDPFLLPRVPLSNDMVNDHQEGFALPLAELVLIKTHLSRGESIEY